jgi:hypothetical protein
MKEFTLVVNRKSQREVEKEMVSAVSQVFTPLKGGVFNTRFTYRRTEGYENTCPWRIFC